jgi:hypothetical protein
MQLDGVTRISILDNNPGTGRIPYKRTLVVFGIARHLTPCCNAGHFLQGSNADRIGLPRQAVSGIRQGQSFVLRQHGADETNTTRVLACVHCGPATYSEPKLRGARRIATFEGTKPMRAAESTLQSEAYSCALLTKGGAQCFADQSVTVKCYSERFPSATRVSTM